MGEPTAGWIIFTWTSRLMDGSVLRLPRARITDATARRWRCTRVPVDIEVKRPIGESYGPDRLAARHGGRDAAGRLEVVDAMSAEPGAIWRAYSSSASSASLWVAMLSISGSPRLRRRAPVFVGVVESSDRPFLDRTLGAAFRPLFMRLSLVLGRSVGPEVALPRPRRAAGARPVAVR